MLAPSPTAMDGVRRGVGEAVRSGDCLGPSIFDASTGSFEF